MLIICSCNIFYLHFVTLNLKRLCLSPKIVNCNYYITDDRILAIDWNSISSKCIDLKYIYSSISTTFYVIYLFTF